jgi:AcrR family transcriptional regulator
MVNERTAQKAKTAKLVLAAARDEFERVGFEAANLRAIAARAGVSAGTVLHHYGEKRDLLHAALFHELDEVLDRAIAAPGGGSLEQQLDRFAKRLFAHYARRGELSKTLLKESLFAGPPWAGRFAAQTARAHGLATELVTRAVSAGELAPSTDVRLVALAWLSFFYFALLGWVQGGLPKPASTVRNLLSQHLRGLRQ